MKNYFPNIDAWHHWCDQIVILSILYTNYQFQNCRHLGPMAKLQFDWSTMKKR